MENKNELQITKTLKYEALYIILGFEEIKEGVFQKKYASNTIIVDTNNQTVDFGTSLSVVNGTFILGNDKSFVILECIDRLLSIGYSPLEIIIDLDNEFDVYVKNIYIKCFEWDWTKLRKFDGTMIKGSESKFLSVIYESRTYSGLIERRYSVSDGKFIYHQGLFENKEIDLKNEYDIPTDNAGMKIQGKKLVSYTGNESKIIIPEGVEEIQSGCFWDNQEIEEIVFPESMKNIGGDTFYNCKNLKKVTITKNVEMMGNNPFAGCPSLVLVNESKHFVFENGLLMDEQRKKAIYYQISLPNESVEIPDTIEMIGKHAFYLGIHLKKVVLPESLKRMENNPFSGCKNLNLDSKSPKYIIEDNIIYSGDLKTLVGTVGRINANPLVLKDIETISRNSFWGHDEIKKIVFPKTLKQIGYNPFVGCTNIEFESNSSLYKVKDGVLYNRDYSKLICCPSLRAKGEYHILDSVLQLERGAFSGCKELKSIHFRNVFSIGKSCFTNCVSLEKVYIPDLVGYIGEWAFAHCSSLKKVSYYQDTYIDQNAFSNTNADVIIRKERTNYLIESENLFSLHSLNQNYKGKIDSILIDPPYNSNIDYIGYKDSFGNHYLKFMEERILISKELLSEKGFLVINIDEGEIKPLLKLCKTIFGFGLVSYSKWKKQNKYFDKNRVVLNPNKKKTKFEYIIFCKRSKRAKFNKIMQPYLRKNMFMEKKRWIPRIFDFFGTTSSAKDEIETIFGDRTYFSTPKPLKLMKELIRATTSKDSIIMDYFAGSGTVGDACFELNREDSGNRKFILVCNDENDICEKVTDERLKKSANKNVSQFCYLK